ncbi:MAG: radical SAM protein [Candidatus Jordarchaeum sp.]|uniref:radical SAM protein n=1 Tax=Candidatus Jordarchaeum sp. TaxID=2823881 RepID=UPI004049A672
MRTIFSCGAIFFSSCTFKCVFCQNYDISTNPKNGVKTSEENLAAICRDLRREGARNINYVGGDPTPNTYTILKAIRETKENVPQLWNSNMYCSKECMKLLLDVMDFWLPDFKYGNDECAEQLSKAPKYWEIVSRNHKMAYDETVEPGTSGMIIRHLVLPGHIECCTEPVLEWIAKNCSKTLVNIMEQYRPQHEVPRNIEYSDIDRRVSREEMEKAYRIADKLGIIWRPVS